MQPPPRTRPSTAFSLDSLAQAEARDSQEETTAGWMPPSPSKLLRRLSLQGTAAHADAARSAGPAASSPRVNRLVDLEASGSHPTSPMKRAKATWPAGTAGVNEGAEPQPQRSTLPMTRLQAPRQQFCRSGQATNDGDGAASNAASRFYEGTIEGMAGAGGAGGGCATRAVSAESRLAARVAARVTPALASKRLDGTVARATAAAAGPLTSSPPRTPGRGRVEIVAAVEPVYHPHFVRPTAAASAPPPWAEDKLTAVPSVAGARGAAAATAQGPTCQTYDHERNALRQARARGTCLHYTHIHLVRSMPTLTCGLHLRQYTHHRRASRACGRPGLPAPPPRPPRAPRSRRRSPRRSSSS